MNPKERFHRDASFRSLVEVMVAQIDQCHYTPSEMREAALLACIMYENTHIRYLQIPDIPDNVKKSIAVFHEWEDRVYGDTA